MVMPMPTCRWCTRPAVRTITVDAPEGAPARMALCVRHLAAVEQARNSAPSVEDHERRRAESEAWERLFREPAPFRP
jgi:hypothetical protein